MIVLNSPKGWTGPKMIDGKQVENNFRSHQVPLAVDAEHPDNVTVLETWLKSYKPEELFDDQGRLRPELAALTPAGKRRMGANPHANGGSFMKELNLPDFREYAIPITQRSAPKAMCMPWGRIYEMLYSKTRSGEILEYSVRTNSSPTDWRQCLKQQIGNGRAVYAPLTKICTRRVWCWIPC
jgi:phosphoketolase